jgi:uncharacterized protein YpuA (DUF1002 family)
MDKILRTVADIREALKEESHEDLQTSSEELVDQLGYLRNRAEGCMKDLKSVVEKFTEWHGVVNKIILAYSKVQGTHHMSHV